MWHSSGAFLFFYFVLEKKLQIYLQRENVQDYLSILKLNRKKKKISPTEKVVNEHEKMLARVSQGDAPWQSIHVRSIAGYWETGGNVF